MDWCKFEEHKWELTIEDGTPILTCLDPHDEEELEEMFEANPTRGEPACGSSLLDYAPETLTTTPNTIPVRVKLVTDYTPGEFGGQGEYDAWLELSLKNPYVHGYDPERWEESCTHHIPCGGPCGSGLRRKRV
jgi:hypothetical protein